MQADTPMPSEPSTSSIQSGIVLPSPSMQNQIHELAKTLPPPRKQNTACDACRARKVKCHRLPGQEKHCVSKNYPCTHFVQQATSEKKRTSAPGRRKLSSANSSPPSPNPFKNGSPSIENGSPGHMPLSSTYRYSFYPPVTMSSSTREVLAYLFSPPEIGNDPTSFTQIRVSPYFLWGEQASKLEEEAFRVEFALDLVEVFFQIVHTRLPLLNPEQFRNSLRLLPSHAAKATKHLHPALVATVISWGAKFSEHPLLVADRRRNGNLSALARTLILRTRELAEALKVHRMPKDDHVVIGLLIEPLQSRYHGFWLASATRHLMDLGINHKSVISSANRDTEERGTMIFAWWMACICDAYASLYYRHKPILDDDDYDIDFYTVDPINPDGHDGTTPSPREQLEGYYRAAHALARTARQMSRQLWKPATEADGLPFDILYTFFKALTEWRDDYLRAVGVPSNENQTWDFVTAVSSCASDAQYHVMWIILFNALDEVGVKEINEITRLGVDPKFIPEFAQMDSVMQKIADEALHGACRISALRLDPAVMHVSCIQAGTLLARLGRPEAINCINGLEQYSLAYEEAGDHASEIRRIYRTGESDFNHMSSVAPRVVLETGSPGSRRDDMQIDER
ncbi:hypothetical protein EDD85DRAFT_807791 [Armillaria nabsnona]|nr:hypothetical protein EDD85DRAFT_807791 [Armillaria nabsnona]